MDRSSVCPSVCPSVCLSQAAVLPESMILQPMPHDSSQRPQFSGTGYHDELPEKFFSMPESRERERDMRRSYTPVE